jgi:transcriptional regulator with GAF, ATPase, and Fis domain
VFARKIGRSIEVVPPPVLAALQAHPWPGNVRELEHLIERAVILSPGPELRLPPEFADPGLEVSAEPVDSLRSNEREVIRRALESSRWVIGGPNGAAERLGLKRTTLLAKMKRHGLHRPSASAE